MAYHDNTAHGITYCAQQRNSKRYPGEMHQEDAQLTLTILQSSRAAVSASMSGSSAKAWPFGLSSSSPICMSLHMHLTDHTSP